jgi:adenylate kinase
MIAAIAADSACVQHIKASSLLRETDRPVEKLTQSDAILNQKALAKSMDQQRWAKTELVLIDGHVLIETVSGPLLLPDEVLIDLKVEGIIFITADAHVVAARRIGSGMEMSETRIAEFMALEAERARSFAERMQLPYALIDSGDIQNLKVQLFEMFRQKAQLEGDR